MRTHTLSILIIFFFSTSCENNSLERATEASSDTVSLGATDSNGLQHESKRDYLKSKWPNLSYEYNSKFICGFTDKLPNNITPDIFNYSTWRDSVIEKGFQKKWGRIIFGRPDALIIERDPDQTNVQYAYAMVTGKRSKYGHYTRTIQYKSGELYPLLSKENLYHFDAIALHELGHVAGLDDLASNEQTELEQSADAFAGYYSWRLDSKNLDIVLNAYKTLITDPPKEGYPKLKERLEAVRSGWNKAHEPESFAIANALRYVSVGTDVSKQSKFVYDANLIANAVIKNMIGLPIEDTSILKGLQNVAINTSYSPGKFYIDNKHLYFKTDKNLLAVGTMTKSNRPEYDFMIYDRYFQFIYIGKDNNLTIYAEPIIQWISQDYKNSWMPVTVGYIKD